MELYKRIKKRREELGMSQDELAQKLGYKSRSTIAKIEKGENDITYQILLNLTPDLSEAVELYTSLDVSDRGVIRGEMKGMLMHPKYTPTLKELPARFDIAASGLDENTEAGKDNMDIINKRIEELRRK